MDEGLKMGHCRRVKASSERSGQRPSRELASGRQQLLELRDKKGELPKCHYSRTDPSMANRRHSGLLRVCPHKVA